MLVMLLEHMCLMLLVGGSDSHAWGRLALLNAHGMTGMDQEGMT